MACIVMACTVMACKVVACISMPYIVMAYIVMAYVVMTYALMADVVIFATAGTPKTFSIGFRYLAIHHVVYACGEEQHPEV